MFATVGATLPFDRLVTLVAQAKAEGLVPEKVLIQTGIGGARPADLEVVDTLGPQAVLQRRQERRGGDDEGQRARRHQGDQQPPAQTGAPEELPHCSRKR